MSHLSKFLFRHLHVIIRPLIWGPPLFLSAQIIPSDSPLVPPGAGLELVQGGFDFTEGPAVDSAGNVFFTDQPKNRIYKWSAKDNKVTLFMEPAGRANGLYFDEDGELWAAADEKNELWKIQPDGNVTVRLNSFDDKRFNGPNDLWVDPQGGVYFTDPFYLRTYWDHTDQQLTDQRVYYLPPRAYRAGIAADGFIRPNGIIGTPDGSKLYIADIGGNTTYSFDIGPDGILQHRSVFVNLGSDGMTLDSLGNVYMTGDGVSVFNPSGMRILHIAVPEKWTANVTFGGPDGRVLFITASHSVYTLKMNVSGAR